MKKYLLLILLLFLITQTKAQILYTNFTPHDTVSVLSGEQGMDTMDFDINQDGIMDFVLYAYNDPYFLVHLTLDVFNNGITVLDTNSELACRDTSLAYNNFTTNAALDSGEIINNRFVWCNPAVTLNYEDERYGPLDEQPSGPKYYPIKLFKNGDYYYGWIRLSSGYSYITIYDMAINLTPNQPIYAGDTTVGISEVYINESITLSPNPATNQLTLHTTLKDEHATVLIMNVLGQEVFQSSIFNLQSSIDVSSLSSGIYFLRIKTEEGSMVKKFVKE